MDAQKFDIHNQKIFCSYPNCKQIFPYRRDYERHYQAEHSSLFSHVCTWPDGCGKKFSCIREYAVHYKVNHLGEPVYLCDHPECSWRFPTKASKRWHFKNQHEKNVFEG